MPPRQFENRSLEPGSRRWSFLDEEKVRQEQPPEKTTETTAKKDEKNPDQSPAKKEKTKPEKLKPKELSPQEKQEKRNDAIERSYVLKNTFEEKPLPNNPSTVARLIIAEQIIDIDEQLQNPESFDDAKAKQKLEATLDYMCELAEKLETPALESSPHIQEAYETLLALTEKALETSSSPAELVVEITETLQTKPIRIGSSQDESLTSHAPLDFNTPASPAVHKQPKSSAATKLLAYIHASPSRGISPRPAYISGDTVSSGTISMPADTHPSHSPHPSTPAELQPTTIRNASEYHRIARPNTALPLASVALASVAAANFHKTPQISHRHESTQPLLTKERTDFTESSASYHEHKHRIEINSTPLPVQNPNKAINTNTEHRSVPYAVEATPATGKLEHLPLLSLLALAKDVNVGHGRYLKDEFEHGRIDKNGLIKVLKAKKKGMDFSQEFNHQAATFRERLASIEFITKPPKPMISHDKPDEAVAESPAPKEAEPNGQKKEFTHPILERYANPEKSLFQPSLKNTLPINLIVTIFAIIIFGALILFLLLPA